MRSRRRKLESFRGVAEGSRRGEVPRATIRRDRPENAIRTIPKAGISCYWWEPMPPLSGDRNDNERQG